ncbi:MAG: FecR domain-containing protein [Spirochaetes bacterium]|nr:FecR domain-containing protein [Spirochaetota bacterium]
MKSLNKSSLLIVLLCVAVILLSSYYLYKELMGKIDRSDEDAIGTLVIKKNVAERKYGDYVIWESISNSAPFFNYDSVRTVAESSAYLQFNESGEISIDEETMIIIVSDKNGVKINCDQGAISAKNNSSKSITINTKDFSISTNQGEFSVKKRGDIVDIDVLAGEAIVNRNGEISKLHTNDLVHATDEKFEIINSLIIPASPSNNIYFVICKNSDRINFKWNSALSGNETVQVALDSNFKNIKYSGVTKDKSYSIDIEPGDYYWRVISSKEISQSRKFTVLIDKQPEMIFPDKNSVIQITEDEMVSFKWTKSDFVRGYKLYLSQGNKSQNLDNHINCEINSINISNLEPGRVIYNVSYDYPDSFNILFDPKLSGVFDLKIVPNTYAKPKLLNEDNFKVSKFLDNINFNWLGSKWAENYTVDISADKNFKEILKTSATRLNFYSADMLPEGKYFFRVSAIYSDDKILTSDIITFNVITPLPVKCIYPENGSTVTNQSDFLKFVWEDTVDSQNYLFELSSDPNFKNTIDSVKTDKVNTLVKMPAKGKYYWRTAITDKSGESIATGKTVYFTVADSIVLIYPKNMAVLNIDGIDFINCKWNSVEGADSYEIEFFQSVKGLNRPVLVVNSKRTDISLRNFSLFNSGEVKWAVRAKRIDKGKSITVGESEKSSFIIRVSKNISAPKVKSPEVIYVK